MELYYNRTGAARKELVAAIQEITGIKSKYLGAPSMAYQIGDYRIAKDGTLSWPDLNDADPELLSQREYMIEQLMERGFEAEYQGYEEDQEKEESLQITISMPLEKVDVGNLLHLLEAKGDLIKKALEIENTFIKEENEVVEFPWFENITPEETMTYTKFIAALCQMSIKQKRVTAKVKEYENEKYAFRCLLLRLGFIGDEFKADRKLLLSKLDGSAAFKSGHKKAVKSNAICKT